MFVAPFTFLKIPRSATTKTWFLLMCNPTCHYEACSSSELHSCIELECKLPTVQHALDHRLEGRKALEVCGLHVLNKPVQAVCVAPLHRLQSLGRCPAQPLELNMTEVTIILA